MPASTRTRAATRRRGAWVAMALGVLIASGAAVAVVTGERAPDRSDPLDPVVPPPLTIPVAGVGNGLSVVQPANGQTASTAPAPARHAAAAAAAVVVPGEGEAVRQADVRLRVAAGGFVEVFDRVVSVASVHGGFVASSSSVLDDEGSSGQLALRVPVDRFDAARQDVARLGTVESQSLRGDDVTGQLVDYDARLRALEAQEGVLRNLVGRATSVGEVLQVQPTLTNVRQQIEQLQGQRARLEKAVALATIVVSIREPGSRPAAGHSEGRLGRRVDQALDGALAVVGGVIVVVGWLTPVAILALVAVLVLRLRRRSRPRSP